MRKPPLDLIKHALEEDGAEYDITTLSTVPEEHLAHASLIARQNGVVAGLSVAAATFQLLDERIVINLLVQDGDTVHSDQVLAHLEGPARSLLSAERVALNFLGHLSGIATVTARCVQAIEGTPTRVLDTRKTTPGLRSMEKDAVLLGGGQNHRFGLSDGVLIKDNHIKAAGGIVQAVNAARRQPVAQAPAASGAARRGAAEAIVLRIEHTVAAARRRLAAAPQQSAPRRLASTRGRDSARRAPEGARWASRGGCARGPSPGP